MCILSAVFVRPLNAEEENIIDNIIINVMSLFARCESTMTGCINPVGGFMHPLMVDYTK